MINQRQSIYPDREPVQTSRATSICSTLQNDGASAAQIDRCTIHASELQARAKVLVAAQAETEASADGATLLHGDLAVTYREKVARLTDAFEDQALQTQAFERIRLLIEAVVLTPDGGELAIDLRGELASMLELCACPDMQNAPEEVSSKALQIKLVAGTGFGRCRTRLPLFGGTIVPS